MRRAGCPCNATKHAAKPTPRQGNRTSHQAPTHGGGLPQRGRRLPLPTVRPGPARGTARPRAAPATCPPRKPSRPQPCAPRRRASCRLQCAAPCAARATTARPAAQSRQTRPATAPPSCTCARTGGTGRTGASGRRAHGARACVLAAAACPKPRSGPAAPDRPATRELRAPGSRRVVAPARRRVAAVVRELGRRRQGVALDDQPPSAPRARRGVPQAVKACGPGAARVCQQPGRL